jgi:hypothetical protein
LHGQFQLELHGHFELELGAHFKLELGGQYGWNLHFAIYILFNGMAINDSSIKDSLQTF